MLVGGMLSSSSWHFVSMVIDITRSPMMVMVTNIHSATPDCLLPPGKRNQTAMVEQNLPIIRAIYVPTTYSYQHKNTRAGHYSPDCPLARFGGGRYSG